MAELERKRLAPRSSLVKSSFIQPFITKQSDQNTLSSASYAHMKFLAADYQDPDELEMAAKRKKLAEEQRRMAMQLRQRKESICE